MQIIAIDGAFKEFPLLDKQKYYSTDGCIDIAKQYADYYIPANPFMWQDQAQKRNIYLKVIPMNSYIFVLDADEELVSIKWDDSQFTEDVYKVKFFMSKDKCDCPTVRIYKTYPDLKYMYQHCRLYRMRLHDPKFPESGCVTKSHSGINMVRPWALNANNKPIYFIHHNDKRPKEREEQDKTYMAIRKEQEWTWRKK